MIDTDQQNMPELLVHYRGMFTTRNNSWFSSYIDVGSKRALSVPHNLKVKFFIAALFVYGIKTHLDATLVDDNGHYRKMVRIFVNGKFPFLSFKPSKGTYKTFYFKIGFDRIQSFVIRTDVGTTDILTLHSVQDENLLPTLENINAELMRLIENDEPRNFEMFGQLERSIETIRSQLPRDDTAEALILLYCIFQRNHRTAHKLLKQWTSVMKKQGKQSDIDAFYQKLDRITFPLALGRHGFNPSFKYLNLDSVESELFALMKDLSNFGVQPFLNSGTLLGYFRDGCPIPHDDDFDLGILVNGETEGEMAKEWRDFVSKVANEYQVIDKGSFLALKLSNGVQVDLFCAWSIYNKLFIHPYCWADIGADALLPMQDIEIRGRKFAIPSNPDAVLTVNYGKNWRVPDPFWSFDFKKSKRRFRGVLKKLKSSY